MIQEARGVVYTSWPGVSYQDAGSAVSWEVLDRCVLQFFLGMGKIENALFCNEKRAFGGLSN